MNQDEILQGTRTVVQSLETLKNEHTNMIKTFVEKLDSFKNDSSTSTIIAEEISILKNSDEMVHLGISEASVLIQLSNYLQTVEAEKQKIKSQVKRLCQENAWLRDELAAAQKKLQESEQNSAQIEVELSHLKFLKELKKFDDDLTTQQQQQQQQQQIGEAAAGDASNKIKPASDSIFPEDEDENAQGGCMLVFLIDIFTNFF